MTQVTYALPTASATVLGGIKVGSGLSISNSVLSAGAPSTVELDYIERTTVGAIAATSEATATTLITGSPVVYDGSTVILVECFFPVLYTPANQQVNIVLYDGSTSLGSIGQQLAQAADLYIPISMSRRLTPSAASHTYSIRAFKSGGSPSVQPGVGGTGNIVPGYIRIVRVY